MKIAIAGATIVLAFGLAACGGGNTGKTDEFSVVVTGHKVTGAADLSVKQGDTVRVTITTDKDEEIHLHGYDIHFECKADVPVTKTFTADKTGQFEYELEATTDHLGNLIVNP